jgi:diacylglycerol kinase (ATP)
MNPKVKKVCVIINPASGADTPVLSIINRFFKEQKINWDIFITKTKNDATNMAKEAIKTFPDAIIVYGGDGTVTEVASAIYTSNIPLCILPGGTANILAKELNIPLDINQALDVLKHDDTHVDVDVWLCNQQPFFLRIEVGLLADMVRNVTREQKKQLGVLAYPLQTLQQITQAPVSTYTLFLDKKHITTTGVGLMVANMGNIGVPNVSIQSTISPSDNQLDIIVLTSADIASIIGAGSSALIGTAKPDSLKHWQMKKQAIVSIDPAQTVVVDDQVLHANELFLEKAPAKLRVML